jgi:hypothetical protein
VVIPVASSDTTEGTVSASSLTFTAADWNVPQTVTVTGVDDLVDDGDIAYNVVLGAPTTARPDLRRDRSGRCGGDQRRRRRGWHHRDAGRGPRHHQAGGTASFTVVLTSQPTADVVIRSPPAIPTRARSRPRTLRLPPPTGPSPQTVTVTGVDDLSTTATSRTAWSWACQPSADPIYAAIDPADVAVTNADNDEAGITVTPVAGLGTTEAGGTASFTVVLTSEPTADVVIRSPPAIPPRARSRPRT